MEIKTIPVESKKMQKKMLNLPWHLYKKNPYWVPPLRISLKHIFSPGHPFYQTARTRMFVASCKEEGVKGRIMGIINDVHNDFHGEKCGFFWFF